MEWARRAARFVLRWVYRVEVIGLDHYAAAGPRVLIAANHVSFLDPVLLSLFLPGCHTFAIDPRIARLWWVRPFLAFAEVLPVDPARAFSTKALIRRLQQGGTAVVFPEGRISVTGSLMKIYAGPAFVADRADAVILPIRIAGAEYTAFSPLRGRVRPQWFPRITLTVLPPRRLELPDSLQGSARRREAATRLADLMTEMMFRTTNYRRTLVDALLNARRIHGGRRAIAEDLDRTPLSYDQLLNRMFTMAGLVQRDTAAGDRIGVLLPGTVPAVVVFLAVQLAGRVPAMLNFSVGADSMLTACRVAGVRTIYTSRRFVARARLQASVGRLAEQARVIYVEDLGARLGFVDKLRGGLRGRAAAWRLMSLPATRADDPAVVLFTAGSEGVPKAVVLSHANLLANGAQIAARLDFGPTDLVLNTLPPFHAFGLVTGTILPVLSGVRVFLYPSPLDYRAIPEIAYDIGATILFGTNTFLRGYARFAHPYDFHRVRYVFAGAERLEPDTRRTWMETFGLRILEGYGTTETAPVLATNTPMQYRPDTVGRFLPGIEYRLDPVPGLAEGGRLSVRGPNVMLGYLSPDRPGTLDPPRTERGEGWYDTGDIVTVDADGLVAIQGRARRFAKVGGEMVSLAVVEQLAGRVWPERRHAAIGVPDPRRGEQVVLLTEEPSAQRQDLVGPAQAAGLSELYIPRRIVTTEAIPLLGAGKTDYVAARALVEQERPSLDAVA